MPNYSLVINSKFHPLTYNEWLAPALLYTQTQQQLEDAYGDLYTKASVWDDYTEGTERAKKQYTDFMNALEEERDRLSQYGLTPSSRQAMHTMRGRYAQDIVPIEQAFARKRAQADAQRQGLINNPTLLFSRRAADTNLDRYLENPNLDYEVHSGAVLEKQVADVASNIAKSARNDSNIQKTLMNKLLPFQYELIRQSGFAPDVVWKTIMGLEGGSPLLKDIVEQTMQASNIPNWEFESEADKERIMNEAYKYLNRGLWPAVGTTTYSNITDSYGAQAALQRQAAALKAPPSYTGPELPYRRLATARALENTKQLNDDLTFLEGLSDGSIFSLNRNKNMPSKYATAIAANPNASVWTNKQKESWSEYDYALNRFKEIARKYGIKTDNWGPNNNRTLINKIKNDIDRNLAIEQTYQINMTDQSQLARIIGENSMTFSGNDESQTGFKKMDSKGNVKDDMSSGEVAEMLSEGNDFNLSYTPKTGFQLSYRTKNGLNTVWVSPTLVGFGDQDYEAAHLQVQDYVNKEQYNYAGSLINDLMTDVYYRFNTQAKKESTSTEKIQ